MSSAGGLVLCSTSREVDVSLKGIFARRQISKRYLAVVSGRVQPSSGELAFPLDNKPCLSRYEVVQHSRSASYGGGWISTVALWPVTGRTHQLRRHMKLFGHPIVGDERYATLPLPVPLADCAYASGGLNELYLWAVEMQFRHPHKAAESEGEGGGSNEEGLNSCKLPVENPQGAADACSSARGSGGGPNANHEMFQVHVCIPEPRVFAALRELEYKRWTLLHQRSNEDCQREGHDDDEGGLKVMMTSFSAALGVVPPDDDDDDNDL